VKTLLLSLPIAWFWIAPSSLAAAETTSWATAQGDAGIERRLACERALLDNPAASFDRKGVCAKIERELKITAGLKAEHSGELTAIASELARVHRATQHPEALQRLERVFGGDPLTFAECVARPTVVYSAWVIFAAEMAGGRRLLSAAVWTGNHRMSSYP